MTDYSPELQYSFSRSGGKGGQNVNKVETKVLLKFDLAASSLMPDWQKAIIREKLQNYITQDDVLQLTCEETRSQLKNRGIVTERFHQLIQTALIPVKPRKKLRVRRSVKEKRLKDKKLRSEKKQSRRKDWD